MPFLLGNSRHIGVDAKLIHYRHQRNKILWLFLLIEEVLGFRPSNRPTLFTGYYALHTSTRLNGIGCGVTQKSRAVCSK